MDLMGFREYCMGKPGVSEGTPFDQNTLVFKVMGKIFTITGMEDFASINLKCDPEKAVELRETYPAVIPGYHMNKQHWNTVLMDGSIPDNTLREWIDHSYQLIVQSLPKKTQKELEKLS